MGDYYQLYGSITVDRSRHKRFEWKIETSRMFAGVYGVVDVTDWLPKWNKNKVLYLHKDVIIIGSEEGGGYIVEPYLGNQQKDIDWQHLYRGVMLYQ